MEERYSLNEQTLLFIQNFEKDMESGKLYKTIELLEIFEAPYYSKEQFDTNKKSKTSSMWYALTRSGQWEKVKRGQYRKK